MLGINEMSTARDGTTLYPDNIVNVGKSGLRRLPSWTLESFSIPAPLAGERRFAAGTVSLARSSVSSVCR